MLSIASMKRSSFALGSLSGRDGLFDPLGAAGQAEGFEHRLLLGSIGAEMPTQKDIGVVQLAQGWRRGHNGLSLYWTTKPQWAEL